MKNQNVTINWCSLQKKRSIDQQPADNHYLLSMKILHIIKNISLREFKKSLFNTFIYESILIKIYMKANILNTQIFHIIKYDLKGHRRSQYVTFMFILTLTSFLLTTFRPCFLFVSYLLRT